MKISITYYAQLRELADQADEVVETNEGNAANLYAALKEKYGFTQNLDQVRLAVNDAFVSWDRPLEDGDRLVFIPPVAGG